MAKTLEFDVDADYLAYKFYRPLKDRVGQLAREVDNLVGALTEARTALIEEKAARAIDGKVYKERISQLESLEAELLYATSRSREHNHSTKPGSTPVIVTDLHGTLTPSEGFIAPGLPGAMAAPIEGVREALDKWASEGCCIHIATAALHIGISPDTWKAREGLIAEWVKFHNLPISFWTGKVGAHVYYDDRMTWAGDWNKEVPLGVQDQLDYRTEINKAGIRVLRKVPGYGDPIDHYPELTEIINDRPRGISTPIIDVDFHCCLLKSNASDRTSDLNPGALEAINKIYDAGYRIHLSCAGWDPLTHKREEWQHTLAGLRKLIRELGVPYDEIVSKEHGVAFIDNYGLRFNSWPKDLPTILSRLKEPGPRDEVTILTGPSLN